MGKPKDWFSRVKAHIMLIILTVNLDCKCEAQAANEANTLLVLHKQNRCGFAINHIYIITTRE